MKRLHLILGDQLFDCDMHYKKLSADMFFMMEDYELCTHYKYHKQKILLFLTAMREFKNSWNDSRQLIYNKLDQSKEYMGSLEEIVKTQKITHIQTYQISDHFFKNKIQRFCTKNSIEFKERETPAFLTSKEFFKEYCESSKTLLMKSFYKKQRVELNILVDKDNQPVGGKWSFDEDNRKKLPKDHSPPNSFVNRKKNKEVVDLIDKNFTTHPGEMSNFIYPTTRDEALYWLESFFKQKFKLFGDYEDAISKEHNFIYHSLLSPVLNLGLLTPKEVIDKAIAYSKKNKVPINSLEGFIRQIVGWREFVKGIYDQYSEQRLNSNFFNHKNNMSVSWYTGDTGIPILDHSIKKAINYGYCHHIERLMVLSNLMLLCEIQPKEVYSWFMSYFVDSADWVMSPNVYSMGQFSDGGIFATKPYICGSNYLLKMSDFPKGDWCDVVDGLYWRFIDKHKDYFKSNPRLSMMTRMLKKLNTEKKQRIFKAADSFLEENTFQ